MIPRDSQMQKDKHILDNRLNTVVNYLRAHLPSGDIPTGIGVFYHLRLRGSTKRIARYKGCALSLWRSGIGWRGGSRGENTEIF